MLDITKYKVYDVLMVRFRPSDPIWKVQIDSFNGSDPNQKRLNVKGITQAWHGDGIIDDESQIIENITTPATPIDYQGKYIELLEALKVIAKHLS